MQFSTYKDRLLNSTPSRSVANTVSYAGTAASLASAQPSEHAWQRLEELEERMAALVARLEDSVPLNNHEQHTRGPFSRAEHASKVREEHLVAHAQRRSPGVVAEDCCMNEGRDSSPYMSRMATALSSRPPLSMSTERVNGNGWFTGAAAEDVGRVDSFPGQRCEQRGVSGMPAELNSDSMLQGQHDSAPRACIRIHTAGGGICVEDTPRSVADAHTPKDSHISGLRGGASTEPCLEHQRKASRSPLLPTDGEGTKFSKGCTDISHPEDQGYSFRVHGEPAYDVSDETVAEVLQLREHFLQFRDCRDAVTAVAGGARDAAAAAAFDPIATVEAVADAVIDDVIEEHVDELLAVCDNCVDVLFAEEFACSAEDGWCSCTDPDVVYLTQDRRQTT